MRRQKIIATTLPVNSVLRRDNVKYDYIDSFQGSFIDESNSITSQQIGKAFFRSAPGWVEKLFIVRNKIVAVFGLKTSRTATNRQQLLNNFKCEPNEQLGLFKVFDRTDNEVILGEDDKHLNFRVSLFKIDSAENQKSKNLIISTTIEFKNWFGKLYFVPVRPFHKLIVPAMLKGIIKEIEAQQP